MHLFKWSAEKYKLGIENMDCQHTEIIKAITDLLDALALNSAKEAITPLLSSLVIISRQHFHDEEQLMLDYHYPDIESHIGRHMVYSEALAKMVVHFQHKDISMVIENLRFMSNWFIEHVSTADAHYSNYIKQRETA